MHELGITRNLVAIVNEAAKGAAVKRVALDVGELSGIMPDAIAFCFEICAKGTMLEGATLNITKVPGQGHCKECGSNFPMNNRLTACVCGSRNIALTGGDDIKIRTMDLAEVA